MRPMKTVFLIAPLFLLAPFLQANDIAESQQKWVEVYQKQKNIPEPGAMLVNEDPEPDLGAWRSVARSLFTNGLQAFKMRRAK